MANLECKICHRHAMRRINRRGFVEQQILTPLGYYPWECVFCRERQYIRMDGTSSQPKTAGSERLPPDSSSPADA